MYKIKYIKNINNYILTSFGIFSFKLVTLEHVGSTFGILINNGLCSNSSKYSSLK